MLPVVTPNLDPYLWLQKQAFEQDQGLPFESMHNLPQRKTKEVVAVVVRIIQHLDQTLLEPLISSSQVLLALRLLYSLLTYLENLNIRKVSATRSALISCLLYPLTS